VGSYIASVQTLAANQSLSTKGQNLSAEHDTFYVKSLVTPSDAPMSTGSLSTFADYLANEGFESDTARKLTIVGVDGRLIKLLP
jgi:hypothetical protein